MKDVQSLLGDVVAAARDKVASMLESSSGPENDLRLAAAAGGVPASAVDRVIAVARQLGAKKGSAQALDAYLTHPFRVARIALALDPAQSAVTFTISALHNVYEISGADERELISLGIDEAAARAIRVLTIDRERENDPAYLTGFYGAIEEQGLALIRTLDKLDNVLGLELLEEGAIKTAYVDLAEQFVGPMAERLAPSLGDYFARAIAFARQAGCDEARLAVYRVRTEAQ